VVLTEVETKSSTLDDTRYLQEASGESNLVPTSLVGMWEEGRRFLSGGGAAGGWGNGRRASPRAGKDQAGE
jgi:hypothetical protein